MNPKIVIAALIVLGLLFIFGVGAGLLRDDEDPDPSTYEPEGLVKFIDSVLVAPFSKRWKPQSSWFAANCQRDGFTVKLSKASPTCDIAIPGIGDGFLKGTLRAEQTRTTVRVAMECKESQARGVPTMKARPAHRLKESIAAIKLPQSAGVTGTTGRPAPAPRLDVTYMPTAKGGESLGCWRTLDAGEPVRLMVIENEGDYKLRLQCRNCTATPAAPLRVKVE